MQDTYIWYEAVGDQYEGCMLLGLPLYSYKFALIGPHFVIEEVADDDSAVLITKSNIQECVRSCFLSSFPMNFIAVLMHGFAHCLFNFDTLDNLLPVQHCLHSCFPFKGYFSTLRLIAKCGLSWLDGFMNVMSTGIPPHVALLMQMQELIEGDIWPSKQWVGAEDS